MVFVSSSRVIVQEGKSEGFLNHGSSIRLVRADHWIVFCQLSVLLAQRSRHLRDRMQSNLLTSARVVGDASEGGRWRVQGSSRGRMSAPSAQESSARGFLLRISPATVQQ